MKIDRAYFKPEKRSWLWEKPQSPSLSEGNYHIAMKMALIEGRVQLDDFPGWWAGAMQHMGAALSEIKVATQVETTHINPVIRLYSQYIDVFEELHRRQSPDIRKAPPSEPLLYMGGEGLVLWVSATHEHIAACDGNQTSVILRSLGVLQKFGALSADDGVPKEEIAQYTSHILELFNDRLLLALEAGAGGKKAGLSVSSLAGIVGAVSRLNNDGFPIDKKEVARLVENYPVWLESFLGRNRQLNEDDCRVFIRSFSENGIPLRPGSALHGCAVILAKKERGQRRPITEALRAAC